MRIFGMGMPELVIILAVILLIFGPKNLPKLGSALGKTVKGLREGMGGSKAEADAAEPEAADAVKALEESEEETPEPKKRVVRKKTTTA